VTRYGYKATGIRTTDIWIAGVTVMVVPWKNILPYYSKTGA
jgi:hypothetical protein